VGDERAAAPAKKSGSKVRISVSFAADYGAYFGPGASFLDDAREAYGAERYG
jgi:hypothetical protein